MTRLRRCKPIWRRRLRIDDADSVVSGSTITMLPDDVLGLVLQHVDFQGKCNMQLVCRRFSTLLSRPSLGLWGGLNLVTDIMNRKQKDEISRHVPQSPTLLRMPLPCDVPVACPGIRKGISKCRWLFRRLQGFTRIRCDTNEADTIDNGALLALVAKLSGASTASTEVAIVLTPGPGSNLNACSMYLYRPGWAKLRAWGFRRGPLECITRCCKLCHRKRLKVCLYAPYISVPACRMRQIKCSQRLLFNALQA